MKKLRITVDGNVYEVTVEVLEDSDDWAPLAQSAPPVAGHYAPAVPAPVAAPPVAAPPPVQAGEVVSPLAATVVSVLVSPGEKVAAGQALIVLEAMKMESTVSAPAGGIVQAVYAEAGASVGEGQPLLALG